MHKYVTLLLTRQQAWQQAWFRIKQNCSSWIADPNIINFIITRRLCTCVAMDKVDINISTCGGQAAPAALHLRRRPSHTGRENPRTPVPSWHWEALPVRLPTWAIHGPQADLGRFFTSALAHGTGEVIFLTPAQNSLPRGVEPRTWGGATEPPNQLS